jgi:hypothetical protein
MPVSGVVSGVPAGKEGRRDANPDTRAACAPRQKSFVQGTLRIPKDFYAFALTRRRLLTASRSAFRFHLSGFKLALSASLLLCASLSPAARAQAPTPAPTPTNKPAACPAWWFEREVIRRTDPQNNSPAWPGDYPLTDDYSVINQGQLKNLAAKAYAELQAKLPATVWTQPAGTELQTIIAGWSASTTADNYAVVNEGQLKTVAKKFYDVLATAGYVAGLSLPPPDWTTGAYPWTDITTDDDAYAAINTGQAKRLFSFDLTNFISLIWQQQYFGQTGIDPAADPDGDGLTNLQEYQQGSDPTNYYSQGATTITPTISIVSGNNQTGVPSGFIANPLVVKITNSQGTELVNAPVSFAVTQGGGKISAASTGQPFQDTLALRTDGSGVTQVYFQSSPNPGSNSITVTSGSGQVVFAMTTSITDTDANGLPDNWETAYFHHLGVDPEGDPDLDGIVNAMEFALGTDPTAANGDWDSDGVSDLTEITSGANPAVSDSARNGSNPMGLIIYTSL